LGIEQTLRKLSCKGLGYEVIDKVNERLYLRDNGFETLKKETKTTNLGVKI
jgi:hypothetical protein